MGYAALSRYTRKSPLDEWDGFRYPNGDNLAAVPAVHRILNSNTEVIVKNTLMVLLVSFAVLAVQGSAFAADDAKHPCKQIEAACKGAGFTKGDHKNGKGLWKDCIKPIMTGGSVAGVTVDATVVQACQARRAAHAAKQKSGT
jgi:hypothetical protein